MMHELYLKVGLHLPIYAENTWLLNYSWLQIGSNLWILDQYSGTLPHWAIEHRSIMFYIYYYGKQESYVHARKSLLWNILI